MKLSQILLTAAVSGILAGAASQSQVSAADDTSATPAAVTAGGVTDKHACKGLNSCKGNGADGKNACKGAGGCATVKHDCKGKNDCKAQGAGGKNDCKGKGECKVPAAATK